MTTLVVGRGLLGSQVVRAIAGRSRPVITVPVPWHDPDLAFASLQPALRAAEEGKSWRMAWCAGAGVIATRPEQLHTEVALFERVLSSIRTPPESFFLSSSAGGVYAGSPAGPPFDELSPTRALVPYGEAKLLMEDTARRLAERGSRVVLGRIANLYGPGQDLTKPQGLVSQLCLSGLTRQPLSVYASLDTLRDYVFAEDAGRMVMACLDRISVESAGSVSVKVLASGTAVSISELIGAVTRLFRRRPRLSTRPAPNQVRDLRLRSVLWPEVDQHAQTPLIAGLGATVADIRRQLLAGDFTALVRAGS
jgi:UDP-glucose 4-epimerase